MTDQCRNEMQANEKRLREAPGSYPMALDTDELGDGSTGSRLTVGDLRRIAIALCDYKGRLAQSAAKTD